MSRGKPELRAECQRLRREERLSVREIEGRTGASRGSVSIWVRDDPLTSEEKRLKRAGGLRKGPPKKDRGIESEAYRTAAGYSYSRLEKAKIAEAAVMFRLTLHRFIIFGSPFDGDRADWVVEVPETGKLWKIQVKWAFDKSQGLPGVSLRHNPGGKHRRYSKGDFDFLVGYSLFTDTCYVWSWGDLEDLKCEVAVSPESEERWGRLRD